MSNENVFSFVKLFKIICIVFHRYYIEHDLQSVVFLLAPLCLI